MTDREQAIEATTYANKTSAKFMVEVSKTLYLKENSSPKDQKRHFLIFDLFGDANMTL